MEQKTHPICCALLCSVNFCTATSAALLCALLFCVESGLYLQLVFRKLSLQSLVEVLFAASLDSFVCTIICYYLQKWHDNLSFKFLSYPSLRLLCRLRIYVQAFVIIYNLALQLSTVAQIAQLC
jgi:hypothetical protein